MTKVGLIKFLLIILILPYAEAQKLKYKDIFGLLSTKQYDQAEPFLKRYLKENNDNPNAFLYMGIVYQEKSGKPDILKQTPLVFKNIDSAIFFYDKAKKTIDEREVRKNDEYYQAYNRRDLRTGEFGVKLSDIQFDLDKRMEGLRERRDRIKMVQYYFTFADSLYKKTNALYLSIQDPYASINELYLRSSDSTLTNLAVLAVRFDSTIKVTENYIASMQNVGGVSYKPSLTLDEINDFKKDGVALNDFYQNELHLWNYKKFATESKDIIEKEIIPLREHLISFDAELNKLAERLKTDSVSVRSDLTRLTEKLLSSQLKKFEPDPLPLNMFSLKMADLEYKSSIIEDKPLRDSADLHLQCQLSKKEMSEVQALDTVASKLMSADVEKGAMDFKHFVMNAYNNPVVLKNYVKGLKEYADREMTRLKAEISGEEDALRWLRIDSTAVPLFQDSAISFYKPLVVVDEKYTVGLTYPDSLDASGYFYSITPSRIPDVGVNFPVDKINFKQSRLPEIRTITADVSSQIYYVLIYAESGENEKYPSTLAKIYRSDGLSWSNNLQLDFIPTDIQYKQDTGDLVISTPEKMLIVDKNGNVK